MIPIPGSNLVLVKNIDIFNPIIDDPHIMGQISACNVTNDIFAMNVPEISGILVFLAIQTKTPLEVAEGILEGIKYFMGFFHGCLFMNNGLQGPSHTYGIRALPNISSKIYPNSTFFYSVMDEF